MADYHLISDWWTDNQRIAVWLRMIQKMPQNSVGRLTCEARLHEFSAALCHEEIGRLKKAGAPRITSTPIEPE